MWERRCHLCGATENLFYCYPLPEVIDPYYTTGWLLCPRGVRWYDQGKLLRAVRLLRALA